MSEMDRSGCLPAAGVDVAASEEVVPVDGSTPDHDDDDDDDDEVALDIGTPEPVTTEVVKPVSVDDRPDAHQDSCLQRCSGCNNAERPLG